MQKKKSEESLIDALSWASLRSLPEEDTRENVWIRAIAKVSKRDGSTSYVAMCKDKNGKPTIVKDFGTASGIVETISIHPYQLLETTRVPKFKTRTKEERIEWLKLYVFDEDVKYEELSLKQLDKMVIDAVTLIETKSTHTKEERYEEE